MAKFSDLPTEIQDMILTEALRLYSRSDLPPELMESLGLPNAHYKIRAYRKRNDGRELALVCSRWAEFVHSRVFRNVYLRRPDKISSELRFMSKSPAIKRYCSELDVGLGHVSQRNWWGYVRNVWGYLSGLNTDEGEGGVCATGKGKRRGGSGIKLELRGKLKRPYGRMRSKRSGASGRDTCPELPPVGVVDTLVWGIGVGIEDEEWCSRDSTAAIWQKYHPEPWRLSMVLDSLPNLRHLTLLVPDSFGEDASFHEQLAAEILKWPTTITKLNFEYQRKRPTNRVREPVHLRGIEAGLADTFKALVKRFSPTLEDLYWSGRVSLRVLSEDCIKNAKWPRLRKIRVDFGNYDLEGNWFFDLQRRRPDPWDPDRSEGEDDNYDDDDDERGSNGSWETDPDMDDDLEHNAGLQHVDVEGLMHEIEVEQHRGARDENDSNGDEDDEEHNHSYSSHHHHHHDHHHHHHHHSHETHHIELDDDDDGDGEASNVETEEFLQDQLSMVEDLVNFHPYYSHYYTHATAQGDEEMMDVDIEDDTTFVDPEVQLIPLPNHPLEHMLNNDSDDDTDDGGQLSLAEHVMLHHAAAATFNEDDDDDDDDDGSDVFDIDEAHLDHLAHHIHHHHHHPHHHHHHMHGTTAHSDTSSSVDPDPENEWTARFCYNRSKPRKVPLDKLHKLVFGWTRNMPRLQHMLIITDSERSEGNVQLRVVDRKKCLVFYSTEGNAYWPEQKVLDECWDKDQWDEVKVEACEDAWGTCEVNLRFSPDMLDFDAFDD